MSMFLLAHLSDPHLAPLPTPHLLELAGKRLSGFINWQCNRRHFHLAGVLERIVADLKGHSPDHIAVTGDLINLSLAGEYAPASAWLERLGQPQQVTVVPGNHDTYVRSKAQHPQLKWADYMRGDPPNAAVAFPFVRRRGPAALIGLTTAVPTPPFRATGWLGDQQLAQLATQLDALNSLFRVVLIHHPPVTRPQWQDRRLIDGEGLIAVLKRHGAELVLHGHEHLDMVRWFETPQGRVPAVGVPSASGTVGEKYDAAAYNLYSITGSAGAWRCEMVARGLSPDGGCVVERRRALLAGG